jgi:hypothetical protein
MATTTKSTSTELTAGAGFTYEDTVVAYYLAALLREEHAAGQSGVVVSVALQQASHGHPMDDLVVEFADGAGRCVLALQAKRALRVTAKNEDFRAIVTAAVATRASHVVDDRYAYGFVVEHVATDRYRALNRIIDWAKASPSAHDFEQRFTGEGSAAAAERALRLELKALIGAATSEEEVSFYRHFVALKLDGLEEGGVLRTERINRLQELVATDDDGQAVLLFDRLCRIAREGASTARKWNRATLVRQLRGAVRLHVAPNYAKDINTLVSFSMEGLADIAETIDDFYVAREPLQDSIRERLGESRLVNISGLPGCGKSVVLKHFAADSAHAGPILFLKSDRLIGNGWSAFASALGLRHSLPELLAEIGATGVPIVFIDGIDRVRPDQKGVITDILRAIEDNESLAGWKVVASSRDQGLEPYRAWFPSSFYRGGGIGDVQVASFSEEEAEALAEEKPQLRRLLFGTPAVREIARRPFFAAVSARSLPDSAATPQTEIDLITEWWARAGHDAVPEVIPQRQRALLDFAEAGVSNLGKNIPARNLKDNTFAQIASLRTDRIIREQNGAATYSFTHDIFFEWTFFRLLIELGDDWHRALAEAGEPPLLGRVIGLLAQNSLSASGKWMAGYRGLDNPNLRPQWRREWLTAPPFTSHFASATEEFARLLFENDFALLEKLLVWFQAQHTIPSPIVLRGLHNPVEGVDNVRIADLLGWPSDFQSWGRLLDWLLPMAATLPARLVPHVLEVFGVWQNALADFRNPRSAAIVAQCGRWLIDLEGAAYPDNRATEDDVWRGLGSSARSSLATALRGILLRAARSYPEPAVALFERAVANKRMRDAAYSDLMAFTPIMAEVAPEKVVAVAEAELMEELPQDRFDRLRRKEEKRREWLKELRAIPEADRTPQQRSALQNVHFPMGSERYEIDDVGIDRNHNYYFPASALHEPFASLFSKAPESALRLVRNLSNHATTGWRQVHSLNHRREMGAPLPVTLEFPWGKQTFWGDWHVYNWFLGQLAPQALECAYLALSYWAFKELERGRPASEVIKAIVEGSECYAVLGLSLVLALEVWEVSEVALPIASCQRLWHHDMARVVQEPSRNLDLFGFGFLSRLTGDKARAKEFLDQRQSRTREVRQLAMLFALSEDTRLREHFKAALAAFPADLPYEIEEQRTNPGATAHLRENAERWAGLGDSSNYQQAPAAGGQVMITYEPPVPMTQDQERRAAEATNYLTEQGAYIWATKSLSENKVADGWTLAGAIEFANARDSKTMFEMRSDVGGHAAQSAVSAIAACAIRFQATASDQAWAWDVMSRVERMAEPEGFFGSKIPWHPAFHLAVSLAHDRRSSTPRQDSAERLLKLTIYPLDDVAQLAFQALFTDANDHVRWVAAQLAMELSLHWHPAFDENGGRDNTAGIQARHASVSRAVENLTKDTNTPFPDLPPAWIKTSRGRRRKRSDDDDEGWTEPNPSFNAQFAAKIFAKFPVEAWCQSTTYRPLWQAALSKLVAWTAERLMPSWQDRTTRRDRPTELFEWNGALGDLTARSAPFFELQWVRQHLLAPFLVDNENALGVLSEFVDKAVKRHLLDATEIPTNTLELLNDCTDRVIRDRMFDPGSYRAGEVHGNDMPQLIKALLLVAVERAPGAARFVNGDWSQINLVMPTITTLVSAIGWSSFVMQNFLTLCDRAGVFYPIDDFTRQTRAVLASLPNAKGSWVGTLLPARIAGIVQRLADASYPLRLDQAQELLRVLDALIDLGDRRSAALEQTEAFRGVQLRPA